MQSTEEFLDFAEDGDIEDAISDLALSFVRAGIAPGQALIATCQLLQDYMALYASEDMRH